MSLEAKKGSITNRIWQSIAKSGVEVSSIPKDQLDTLVSTIADGVLIELDAMLGDSEIIPGVPVKRGAEPPDATNADEEQVLWEGRPFLSLVERYVVTNQRVRIISGLIGRDHEDIEFIRIRDVDHTQGITERLMNIGDVQLHSADPTRPVATLRNVADPEKVHEIIRRAMLTARKRYPFIVEQNM